MQRNRFHYLYRRAPRRGAHPPGFNSNCTKLTSINDPEGFIAFCLDLKLWRVRVGDFDRFGSLDDEDDMSGIRAAIADAADSIRELDPEHATRLDAISEAIETD